jgi:hypothetical protein
MLFVLRARARHATTNCARSYAMPSHAPCGAVAGVAPLGASLACPPRHARPAPAQRRRGAPCRCAADGPPRRDDARAPPPRARAPGPPEPRRSRGPPPAPAPPPGSSSGYGDDDGVDGSSVLLSRSQLLSKSVITRTSGANLGIVTQARACCSSRAAAQRHCVARRTRKPHFFGCAPAFTPHSHKTRTRTQLWVDASSWEVLALDVRDSVLYGEQDTVLLSSLRQVGDVILVHDERALERAWAPLGALPLVGADVVTQAGEYLGKARWAGQGCAVCAMLRARPQQKMLTVSAATLFTPSSSSSAAGA